MKNKELLQCAFSAVKSTDITWFEVYSDVVREHLNAEGLKAFDVLEDSLGKVEDERQVLFALTEKIGAVNALEVSDFQTSTAIDFYLDKLNEIQRVKESKDLLLKVQKELITVDDALVELTKLNESSLKNEKCYMTSAELLAEVTEDIEWVVEDYIPNGGLILMSGNPKTGKSYLCLDLVIHLTRGEKYWLNQIPIKPCKVVYIDAENASVLVKKRLSVLGGDKCKDFYIITRKTLNLSRIDLTDSKTMLKIKKTLAGFDLKESDLIIFDSFRRLFSGNENDSQEVANFMSAIEGISPASKLILHHLRKKGQGDNKASDRVRGSVDITASVDGLITIETDGIKNDTITDMHLALARWNEGLKPIQIQWNGLYDMLDNLTSLGFLIISEIDKQEREMRSMSQIYKYLKINFESRTINEIAGKTGLSIDEVISAVETLRREGKIQHSRVDGKYYYAIIREEK